MSFISIGAAGKLQTYCGVAFMLPRTLSHIHIDVSKSMDLHHGQGAVDWQQVMLQAHSQINNKIFRF